MTHADIETRDPDAPKELVEWFDDPFWKVKMVPNAVAFGAGVVTGALAVLLIVRAVRD